MKIPDVADRLRVLSAEHDLPELDVLADHLRRRPALRRADPVSTPMSPELEEAIREHVEAHPHLTQVEVGQIFGVNQGRVSEVTRGRRV